MAENPHLEVYQPKCLLQYPPSKFTPLLEILSSTSISPGILAKNADHLSSGVSISLQTYWLNPQYPLVAHKLHPKTNAYHEDRYPLHGKNLTTTNLRAPRGP